MLNLRAFFTVFPACAGVSLGQNQLLTMEISIPRVCGGEPVRAVEKTDDMMYSPRVRG